MAYSDDYALSQDVTFQNRVRMAMMKAAITIMSESATAYNAQTEVLRTNLATSILQNPTLYIFSFTQASIEAGASGSPLTSASSDGNIDVAIASVWNGVAGATQAVIT